MQLPQNDPALGLSRGLVKAWQHYGNKKYVNLLYPTQRVAEGIMFLTCPSVSQSVSQSQM